MWKFLRSAPFQPSSFLNFLPSEPSVSYNRFLIKRNECIAHTNIRNKASFTLCPHLGKTVNRLKSQTLQIKATNTLQNGERRPEKAEKHTFSFATLLGCAPFKWVLKTFRHNPWNRYNIDVFPEGGRGYGESVNWRYCVTKSIYERPLIHPVSYIVLKWVFWSFHSYPYPYLHPVQVPRSDPPRWLPNGFPGGKKC